MKKKFDQCIVCLPVTFYDAKFEFKNRANIRKIFLDFNYFSNHNKKGLNWNSIFDRMNIHWYKFWNLLKALLNFPYWINKTSQTWIENNIDGFHDEIYIRCYMSCSLTKFLLILFSSKTLFSVLVNEQWIHWE